LQLSYEVDAFGRVRHAIEAAFFVAFLRQQKRRSRAQQD